MSLLDVLRSGVRTADSVTKPLQATVGYRRRVSTSGDGTPIYDPPEDEPATQIAAIVDWKIRSVQSATGEFFVSQAMVLFLNVTDLAAVTAGLGVSDDDIIVTPDGSARTIGSVAGFVDAGTNLPVATEAYLT